MHSVMDAEPTTTEAPAAAAAAPVAAPAAAAPAAAPAPAAAAPAGTPVAYAFRDMRLKVGDRVQLEPPPQMSAGRVTINVVGWVDGESLILSAPMTARGRLALRSGEIVMLRAFTGRNAFAFRSSVLHSLTPPFHLLHLSFPDNVTGIEVRSSPRYRVDLPVEVGADGGKPAVQARMDNISSTGALVTALEPLGAPGDKLKLAFEVDLHGVQTRLKLQAVVRAVKTEEENGEAPRHRHGVEFVDLAPNDKLVLGALVWFYMYEHPRQAA